MKQIIPRFKPYGERSILVEWPSKISIKILAEVLSFKNRVENHKSKEILYINNGYNSLLITYIQAIDKINDEILTLKSLILKENKQSSRNFNHWTVPVCYDKKFGLDLDEISAVKKMSVKELIDRHSKPVYTVYFIGFLPGFLYLGGLDQSLHINRRSKPRMKIKKGAVAIGGSQTGIYPSESPGGWNIIGNSPIDFFDINKEQPCFAGAGDSLSFTSISLEEHHSIRSQIEGGIFDYSSLLSKVQGDD